LFGTFMVMLVTEDSPAERAGVQVNDVVLGVDGVPTTGMDINQVVSRIRGPSGSPVTVRFQRGGQAFDLTIRRKLLTL
jgi:carboxyl-terminal processing protease